ncbi:MAG: GNAT family N-acetyltransferase [Syntrophomonas sp.]
MKELSERLKASSEIDYIFSSVDIASKDDFEEILNLQKLAYQSEAAVYNDYGIPPLIQTLGGLQEEAKNSIILKAVEDRKIVGSVRAFGKDGTCYIGKLIVHPDYSNKGIGKKLIAAIEKCFAGFRYELFTGHLSQKNLAFYQKLGYKIFKTEKISDELQFVYMEKERSGWKMHNIRIAALDDVGTISLIHALSWKEAYKNDFSPQFLSSIQNDRWVPFFSEHIQNQRFETSLFIEDERAVGCITYGKSRDEALVDCAEIVSLYVLPVYWLQKIGYELMQFSLQRLREQGFHQVLLWVLKENKRAIRFYEKIGFVDDGATIEVPMDDKILTDLRYRLELRQ